MRNSLRTVVGLLAFVGLKPVFAQEDMIYQWVDYRDGEVSVAFDEAPVAVALNAIHARTGVRIVVPASAENKILNLKLDRLPLEPAVRSLITSIGFNNFALMYDDTGRPSRAVVVGGMEDQVNLTALGAAATEKPAVQALTKDERDRLQKDIERWNELKNEDRGRIEDRLKSLPESEERDQLVKEYGRQVLEIKK
jgi:tetrahydromethanopterin S-methyltransferase subunit A